MAVVLGATHVIVPPWEISAARDHLDRASTQVTESIPTVAVVLTIIFVWFCLLGLLFLFMKEKKYSGFVTITVTGMGLYHTVQFPAAAQTSAWAADMVSRARATTASAPLM